MARGDPSAGPVCVPPEDWVAFHQLLGTYAAAIDGRAWDLLRSVFTIDCRLDYLAPWGVLEGIDTVVDFTRHFHEPLDGSQHLTSNLRVVELSAEKGRMSSAVSAVLVRHRHPAGSTYRVVTFYDDTVLRTSGGWRIRERVSSRPLLVEGNPEVAAWDWQPPAASPSLR